MRDPAPLSIGSVGWSVSTAMSPNAITWTPDPHARQTYGPTVKPAATVVDATACSSAPGGLVVKASISAASRSGTYSRAVGAPGHEARAGGEAHGGGGRAAHGASGAPVPTPSWRTTAVALSRPPARSASSTSRSADPRHVADAEGDTDLIVVELAVHAVGAQQQAVAGAHRDGQHIDPQDVALETDERGEAVQRHAAVTVLADVEPGGEQLRAHVVVVGQHVEPVTVVVGEACQAVGTRVAEVDERDERPADDGSQQRRAEPRDPPRRTGADARRR